MRHKRLKLCAVLLLGLGLKGIQAQESVNATGGNASGSGGTVNYSVGQVVYQTNSGTSGSIAEGVQQPCEIYVVTAIEDAKNISLSVLAYPNPATDYLTLEVRDVELSNLHFQLFNINGKLLQTGMVTGNPTYIVMSSLAQGTYLVKVIQGYKEVKTFKVIKK
jgi:hypothetical protein